MRSEEFGEPWERLPPKFPLIFQPNRGTLVPAKGKDHGSRDKKANPQKLQLLGVLVLLYVPERPDRRAGRCLLIPVQPLANVVANYTCQHGDKKGKDQRHMTHLLLLEGVAAHTE